MRHTAVLVAMAALLPAGLAGAADKPAPTSRIFDDLAACRAITVDAERLACFDRTAGNAVAARSKGDLLVLDREKVVERKRARFGLALSDGAVFGGGIEDKATEVTEVNSTIREVGDGPYSRYNVGLANGMVWQTTEPMRGVPKVGADVNLTNGLLGAFKMRTGGQMVKVKRLR
jgi:hypothetical protein